MTTSPVLTRHSVPIWTLRREASLNWLALGLLLAAWNASYNDAPNGAVAARPTALRGYPKVSVRAMHRMREDATDHAPVS